MYRIKKDNQIRLYGPRIAVVAIVALAALNGSCLYGTATTLCERSGLLCGPGQVCTVDQDACIVIGGCGDGHPTGDEVCDDGNVRDGDGCSADCQSNETCGNGIIDLAAGEFCDGGDNCSSTCALKACGNRIVDLNEDCDTGGIDTRGCDSDCTFVECEDGHVNKIAHEDCDTGTTDDTSTCDSDCTFPRCGDKHANPNFILVDGISGEQCDTGGDSQICDNDCTLPTCGDGHHNPNYFIPGKSYKEQCDGGAMVMDVPTPKDSSTCNIDCRLTRCGDHYINLMAGELCDDGNGNNNDDCPDDMGGSCKPAVCGDGFPKTQGANTEECDTGGKVDSPTCDFNCTLPVCGDGHRNSAAGEMCEPNGFRTMVVQP